jgi:hypothetical protein
MRNPPFRGASDVWKNDPPSPGTGFTQIQQLVTFLGGSRKVTFMVVSGGTTFGVTFPHSRPTPVSSSSAANSVAGLELLLSTVTVQVLAPGGTGPTAGGTGGGVGLGVGVGIGVGLGRAARAGGGDTPAGTYSSDAFVAKQSASALNPCCP